MSRSQCFICGTHARLLFSLPHFENFPYKTKNSCMMFTTSTCTHQHSFTFSSLRRPPTIYSTLLTTDIVMRSMVIEIPAWVGGCVYVCVCAGMHVFTLDEVRNTPTPSVHTFYSHSNMYIIHLLMSHLWQESMGVPTIALFHCRT